MREKRTDVDGQGSSLQANSHTGISVFSEATLTPEMRTAVFFQRDTTALASVLNPREGPGMIIALPGNERRVRVLNAQPFPQVGAYYKRIQEMKAGDLWNPAKFGMTQSLVVTPREVGLGSCVRIVQAEYFDPATGEYRTKMEDEHGSYNEREGSIAKHLGLERGERSQLKFLDDSNVLYVVRQANGVRVGIGSEEGIDVGDADRMMRDLLIE